MGFPFGNDLQIVDVLFSLPEGAVVAVITIFTNTTRCLNIGIVHQTHLAAFHLYSENQWHMYSDIMRNNVDKSNIYSNIHIYIYDSI